MYLLMDETKGLHLMSSKMVVVILFQNIRPEF